MSTYRLKIGDKEYEAEVKSITPDKARIVVNGTEYAVDLVSIGRPAVEPSRPAAATPAPAAPAARAPRTPPAGRPSTAGTAGSVRSPMPGLILRVAVKEGEPVKAGQTLMVMEAMKMENVVLSPHNGTVRKVLVAEGANVAEGDVLVEVARPEMTTL
jgi:glutaconyl-CoA/methylmalonyl-CoA decarboxylase subunit gamma